MSYYVLKKAFVTIIYSIMCSTFGYWFLDIILYKVRSAFGFDGEIDI